MYSIDNQEANVQQNLEQCSRNSVNWLSVLRGLNYISLIQSFIRCTNDNFAYNLIIVCYK